MVSFFLTLCFLLDIVMAYKYMQANTKFQNIYQRKLSPPIPFTPEAMKKEVGQDPLAIFKLAPKLSHLHLKAICGHIDDVEVRSAQKEVRKYILYFFSFGFAGMLVVGIQMVLNLMFNIN